jgi:hypothetical protein
MTTNLQLVSTVELDDLDQATLEQLRDEAVQCAERLEWALKIIVRKVQGGEANLTFQDALASVGHAVRDIDNAERLMVDPNAFEDDVPTGEIDCPPPVTFESVKHALGFPYDK